MWQKEYIYSSRKECYNLFYRIIREWRPSNPLLLTLHYPLERCVKVGEPIGRITPHENRELSHAFQQCRYRGKDFRRTRGPCSYMGRAGCIEGGFLKIHNAYRVDSGHLSQPPNPRSLSPGWSKGIHCIPSFSCPHRGKVARQGRKGAAFTAYKWPSF